MTKLACHPFWGFVPSLRGFCHVYVSLIFTYPTLPPLCLPFLMT